MATGPVLFPELPHNVDLVSWQEMGPVLVNADTVCDSLRTPLIVTGQHDGPDTGTGEALQGLDCTGPHFIGNRDKSGERTVATDQDNGPAFVLKPDNVFFSPAGINTLFEQGTGAADPEGLSIDSGRDPTSCNLIEVLRQVWLRTYRFL